MGFLFRLFQLELGTPDDHFMAELHEFADHIPDIQGTWPAFDQGDVVDAIGGLQLSMLVELVDHDIGHRVPFQVDDDTGAYLIVRFVVDMGDAFYHLFIHQLPDPVAERVPVDLVRHFRHDDLFPAAVLRIDMQFAAKHDPAPPEMHGGFYAFHAVDDPSGGEIRGLDIVYQFFDRDVPFVDIGDATVNDLGKIMRHHIRGHPHGDAAGAVDEQLGNAGWQYGR